LTEKEQDVECALASGESGRTALEGPVQEKRFKKFLDTGQGLRRIRLPLERGFRALIK
jgi:hypothetical protein